jgi:GrpB-like predicted nucleotidyltransferase (UPF0157 family)
MQGPRTFRAVSGRGRGASTSHCAEVSHPLRMVPDLELRGYVARGESGIPGRRYFSRPPTKDAFKVHVHAFPRGSPHVARHLGFRDRLRGDPKLVALYCELKQRLAAEHREAPSGYQAGKASFIGNVEAEGEGVERDRADVDVP